MLTSTEFLRLVHTRFIQHAADIHSYPEEQFQIEVADVLLDAGLKAFREYSYPTGGKCDVVVTTEKWWEPTHWIEIKPFWYSGHYWKPGKFFDEGPVLADVCKLAKCHPVLSWLLVIAFTAEEKTELGMAENPVAGKRLAAGQLVDAVSRWACSRPITSPTAIWAGDVWCHLLLWEVCRCDERPIPMQENCYLVRGEAPAD
jgi:hypothetical protein